MIDKLISFSLKERLLVMILILLIIAAGIYSFFTIPVDAFPDVTSVQVEILASAPGYSPYEVEKFVTFPLETTLRGLPRLKQLRSISRSGLSVVTAVFEDKTDLYFARQQAFERLTEAREKVPEQVEIALGPIATPMGEIYQYTLEGQLPASEKERVRYLTELRTIQDWMVTPFFKSLPGVSDVNSFGGYIKQYLIKVQPEQLLRYNLTLRDVVEAVQSNNLNAGGNIVERGEQQFIVRGTGLFRNLEDINKTILKTDNGAQVILQDVALVEEGQAIRQGGAIKNGEAEAVGGIVLMLAGENGQEVARRIEKKVEEINASRLLPDGLKIVPFYKRTDIVTASIRTIVEALLLGAFLVIMVLFIFLRSFRSSLVVVLSLPLTILLTFIIMKQTGLTANLMSLGGLAISIGMIIDAAIIQVENIQRHLGDTGLKDESTFFNAIAEVRKPSIFGELIIALTFLPLLSLQGLEGKMFSPLALCLSIAILCSLAISLVITPGLSYLLLKPHSGKEDGLMARLNRLYSPLLKFALKHGQLVVIIMICFLAATIYLVPHLGREFIPIMDEGAFDMDFQMLPGVSLSQAMATSNEIEKRLKKFPELETIVSRTGQTGIALEARGVEKTGFVGSLRPRSEWVSAKTRDELTDKMRQAISDIPGISFSFSQPIACRIDELVAGTRAQLIIKLFGDDLEILKNKAEEIARIIAQLPGATDLVVERISGQPYMIVDLNRDSLKRYGLRAADVLDLVEIAIGGKVVTTMYEGERMYDVVVRYPEEKRNSIENLKELLVDTPAGYRLPLSQLARVDLEEGPAEISREAGFRRIGIEVNVSNRDLGGFVAEAQEKIKEQVDLPDGYRLEWGGQFENQQRAMRRLAVIVPLTIGLIFFLLFSTFNSFKLAGLVLLNLPFALIGGVFSLWISGLYLSVPASIGFIALMGIAVLNGVVLISYFQQLLAEGQPLQEAIILGSQRRLRPVLMTATTTLLGLVPLVFAQGPGAEVQRPLAIVVIGGLVTSTILTMIVLPILYQWMMRKR
ncbi:MAG TPA: CusA/CzcA family heavy metal efflux RND transporter [Candidatus Saccharicenans sp.]|jgi:cobalt-zinc-cadmium resistance protein CzcA|nr:efflux RND transporter permease subunit [Candidatus Saccharicenans sp.]HRD01459.1 CusA/CzcA family heavy metal efflux RND transporter [Candidatus Saccharicenans sp.]